jgi:hypothetical protein
VLRSGKESQSRSDRHMTLMLLVCIAKHDWTSHPVGVWMVLFRPPFDHFLCVFGPPGYEESLRSDGFSFPEGKNVFKMGTIIAF